MRSEIAAGSPDDMKFIILEAMATLCESRPFSRVSIADVAKSAGIARSSFYYHFADRNDAVQWLSRFSFSRGIDQTGITLTWYEGHYATTRLLVQHRALITAAAKEGGLSAPAPFYLRHRQAALHKALALHGVEATGRLEFQMMALAAAEQKMTSAYLEGELGPMALQEFCEHLATIVPRELYRALETPLAKNAPAPDRAVAGAAGGPSEAAGD